MDNSSWNLNLSESSSSLDDRVNLFSGSPVKRVSQRKKAPIIKTVQNAPEDSQRHLIIQADVSLHLLKQCRPNPGSPGPQVDYIYYCSLQFYQRVLSGQVQKAKILAHSAIP